jgi:hypothetical protein
MFLCGKKQTLTDLKYIYSTLFNFETKNKTDIWLIF